MCIRRSTACWLCATCYTGGTARRSIVASIALGVATLVSARILNQCIEAAAQDTTTPGGSRRTLRHQRRSRRLPSLADELRAANMPGVKSVQPLVYDRVSLPDLDGRVAVLDRRRSFHATAHAGQPTQGRTVEVQPTARGFNSSRFAAVQSGDFSRAGAAVGQRPRPARDGVAADLRRMEAAWPGQAAFIVRHAGRDMECLPVGIVDFATDSPLAPMGKNFIGMSVGQAAQCSGRSAARRSRRRRRGRRAGTFDSRRRSTASTCSWNRARTRKRVQRGRGGAWSATAPKSARRTTQRRSTQEIVSGLQIGFLVCSRRGDDRRPLPRLQRDGRHGRRAPHRISACCARSGPRAGRS